MDPLEETVEYPCEPAAAEALLETFDGMAYGNLKSCKYFCRVTCKIPEDQIPRSSVHTLGILGKEYNRSNEELEKAGITPGVYVNHNGSGLFLIHLRKSVIQTYLRRCGKSLRSLVVYNTAFHDLSVSSLTALEKLHVERCKSLSTINGLAHLSFLSDLKIYFCSTLPQLPGSEDLTHLTKLDLSGCISLRELPPLDHLSRLTTLNLSRCRSLRELPPLDHLSQLTELDLSDCISLRELPPLDHLSQLTGLDLSGCRGLRKLPPLNHLSQLTTLRLSRCISLCELPALDHLTHLTTLRLSDCGITELPDDIRSLRSLRRLDLLSLNLRTLPDWLPEIAEEFSLDVIAWNTGKNKAIVYLAGTTVEDIPDMSIFEQPYEMVVEWFKNRRLGDVRTLNEIKVVFLGDGEAGKSHTIARLMNDGGDPDYAVFDGQSTPGIVIRDRDYTVDGRTFRVHYWDFGGQEIMHSMHRIFLTGRTMYVILLNARDDTQSDRAKYWLHNVKSIAPDAPVLLVLNKIDQNENASVDEPDLHGRYEKLTQVVRLSALKYSREEFNARFTNVLLDEIRNTGFLDAQWPVSWTRVKDELEHMKGPYIMGDAYEDICAKCSVLQNRKELLHWFNDLGISFCYDGDEDYALKDYVILRPDWITNALYIILFNRLEGACNGRIPHRSIYQLLENAHRDPQIRCTLPQAKYNVAEIQFVLGVMRKFNLSFADGSDNEFIPMLCQQNSTVDVQYYRRDAEILEFNMEFDYLPNNLLHRLMVERHSELDMSNVWRTGARFEFRELGYSAVVLIDGNTLRFFIRHTDPMHRPNTYLTMLKANVDRIIQKMRLKAPSCKLVYKLDGQRDEFDFETLKLWQKLGMPGVPSPSHGIVIPFRDILNQSAPDGLEDEAKLLDAIKRSCRNIQGDPVYCLNGDGKGMEDKRNRRIRDDLFGWGYHILDQSQRGHSGSGKGVGELDLLLFDEKREPWTVIEALRISSGSTTTWKKHLTKLMGSYNYFGAPFSYLLTYVDAGPGKFIQIWEAFQTLIKEYAPDGFTCLENSFVELNDSTGPQYIKAAKCQYACGGAPIAVYHIFARIPTQDP